MSTIGHRSNPEFKRGTFNSQCYVLGDETLISISMVPSGFA